MVKEGNVSEERINSAVSRILKVKMQLDLFNHPVTHPEDYPDFGSAKFVALSKKAAVESFTLLKNKNNLLPLKKNTKILITGPTSNSMRPLNGGWSYDWQGETVDKYTQHKNTVRKAFEHPGTNVFSQGVSYDGENNIQEAVQAASGCDVIVLCLGENSYTETPGNTHSILLPKDQVDLAKALAETGKKIILVLFEGRPLIFNEIEPLVDAVFMGYLPGNEGGDALADLVYGTENPSGKLPINYPKHPHSFVNYNHKHSDNISVPHYYESDYDQQFEFGDGLSYTTFAYSNLRLDKKKMTLEEKLKISVLIQNTGHYTGKETVLLYISDLYASITPEVKALKGFQKIELAPGEQKKVSFTITQKELSFVNADLVTIAEPGDFEVHIGPLTEKFELIS